ncbi:MAG: thioesterase family protein [Pelagimonas sp.]|jgi:acyl-CoA thioesterase FadM|nr:thioesterase family protein [Pelagimonas sp.]
MYPFLRMTKEVWLSRRQPPLTIDQSHVSHHICWPWDLDLWMELNNGRTLTIYDLGRIPLAIRSGLATVLKQKRWGLTVAGSVVRYRRRVRMFDRVETHSRLLGWDHRFVYIEQSMWKTNGDCSSQIVLRTAVTDKNGIVPPETVLEALGVTAQSPTMPEWVLHWIQAEDMRPWPPEKSG